jgi:hypothetical protein
LKFLLVSGAAARFSGSFQAVSLEPLLLGLNCSHPVAQQGVVRAYTVMA